MDSLCAEGTFILQASLKPGIFCLFEEFFPAFICVTHRKIQEFQVVSGDCGVLYELGQYDLLYSYGAIAQT